MLLLARIAVNGDLNRKVSALGGVFALAPAAAREEERAKVCGKVHKLFTAFNFHRAQLSFSFNRGTFERWDDDGRWIDEDYEGLSLLPQLGSSLPGHKVYSSERTKLASYNSQWRARPGYSLTWERNKASPVVNVWLSQCASIAVESSLFTRTNYRRFSQWKLATNFGVLSCTTIGLYIQNVIAKLWYRINIAGSKSGKLHNYL